MKERLSNDLQKAKSEGGLRTSRIREIVKAAVAEAAVELKAGTVEMRQIAGDAMHTVLDVLGAQGKAADEDIAASVEGVVAGISESQSAAIAQTEAEFQQLQAKLDDQTQQMAEVVGGALMEIETVGEQRQDNLRDRISAVLRGLRDREELAGLRQQYARLRGQIAVLDAKLAAQYGDRYTEVKRHLESAKTWYDQARVDAEAQGVDPVENKRVELEQKAGEMGVAIARKEQQVKESLRQFWQNATQR